ncbi:MULTISPECIES: asparagine synthase (glutamine-hydrolyzing) [unclassified Colwellia]|uniref:asparagine synthase (glutamine-hydrolyzing) n=1 Tax=unclassified Colwellia TaxID=196834 RepID=UPI0015F5E356|nr:MULTISPECIES: asparagine synthase (glutamine-hydrolyzing) [unclassified Colwellia]MBA6234361.1 asparagine synthase (glutamine-hydrolyzing) [Colwellia sp. MB02u-7]MBA6237529.1 asparagine synthase (glutamine-hydrolyzing) [Colwellia sp. MB02u-11]MBA6256276.1 asparagine synthase (glutamine-hydrolyzing) [Colwellia sp. MB3u-28]MBA6260160.1 asparagine synthase (glutamine-hydrolyzing) [Colwellia sp. MB3u-41]MBA6300161.1 asparagine synthase (glutamine-hydrolyzing) [Colwellia sp. MB3u-22]
MCGIVGVFAPNSSELRDKVEDMADAIIRRGPDESGFYQDNVISIGMRRLSIIDLSGGTQPIFNEDGSVVIVFNGEIYNHKALREQLETLGHSFKTHSDTEVLVHLYEEYGEKMFSHIRGMFAFCIWNKNKQEGIIARDHFGIKPLYYTLENENIAFSSELKALVNPGIVKKEINYQAMDMFLAFNYIPAPETIYQNVKKLKPAHYIKFGSGKKTEIIQFWDPNEITKDSTTTKSDNIEQEIIESIEAHLEADVDIASFLSGGIDSSLVTAIASRDKKFKSSYTIRFNNKGNLYDESPLAKSVAEKYGIEFNTITPIKELEPLLRDAANAFDEPFADDSIIPTYTICQEVSKRYKVALSGLGGDELFGGYVRYAGLYISTLFDKLPKPLRKLTGLIVNKVPTKGRFSRKIEHAKRFIQASELPLSQRYLSYVTAISEQARAKLYLTNVKNKIDMGKSGKPIIASFEACNATHVIDKAAYTDLKNYVPEQILTLSDRLSMWHSLELRVPLMDIKLFSAIYSLPGKVKYSFWVKKAMLRNIARAYLPNKLFKAKKQGFESPLSTMLNNELKVLKNNLLSESNLSKQKIFDPAVIGDLVKQQEQGIDDHNKIIFSLIMFQLWYEEVYL